LPKKQRAEPHASWVPLRQAVFKFGMTADDEAAAIHEKPFREFDESASSLELLRQMTIEAEESASVPFSRLQLAKMLLEKSGAHRVVIDPTASTFSFDFGSSSTAYAGTPWAILAEQKTSTEPPEDEEGFVRVGSKEAARSSERYQAVRFVTGLIWHQFMLRAFDRAVSAGSVVLYARTPTIADDFMRMPATAWPILAERVDWQSGTAVAPDGTVYWSLMGDQPHTMAAPTELAAASSEPAMAGRGAIAQGIREAITMLWPSGIPRGLKAKDRDNQILNWLKSKGYSFPGDNSLPRQVQRALKPPA
jgi:hypothetical protein